MPASTERHRLVGDGIRDPRNARALLDASAMFGATAVFRDTAGLSQRWEVDLGGEDLRYITAADLAGSTTIAIENAPGSRSLFGGPIDRIPASVIVGNERRGIGKDLLRSADRTLHIPTAGNGVNTLNVASAGAVALYALSADRTRQRRSAPGSRGRPALVLFAPGDHVEAGSSLRTAAALGWTAVCVEDREHVWFGTPRPIRTEGRAAARSHRAVLRVIPTLSLRGPLFDAVTIVGTELDAPGLRQVSLASGSSSAIVIPDESAVDLGGEDWSRVGTTVSFARIDVSETDFPYRFRLPASIAIAEISRQVGPPRRGERPAPHRRPRYHSILRTSEPDGQEAVTWDELERY